MRNRSMSESFQSTDRQFSMRCNGFCLDRTAVLVDVAEFEAVAVFQRNRGGGGAAGLVGQLAVAADAGLRAQGVCRFSGLRMGTQDKKKPARGGV